MSEIEVTSFCNNCKRDIPQQNFQMHNLHCHRNVRLCKKCEEPVPISEMEAHEEEYHAMVECKCKAKIEKGNLEDHEKKDCLHRTVHCQFCEMDMKYMELGDHEHACGSRTEKCQDCGEFIMLKNVIVHMCAVRNSDAGNRTKHKARVRNGSHFNDDLIDGNPTMSTNDKDYEEIPVEAFKFLGNNSASGADFTDEASGLANSYSSRKIKGRGNRARGAANFGDEAFMDDTHSLRKNQGGGIRVRGAYFGDEESMDNTHTLQKNQGGRIRVKGASFGEKASMDNGHSSRSQHAEHIADNFQDLGISDRHRNNRSHGHQTAKDACVKEGSEVRAKKRSATRDQTPNNAVSVRRGITGVKVPLRDAEKRSRTRQGRAKETKTTAIDVDEPPAIEADSWDERYHERVRRARIEKEAQTVSKEVEVVRDSPIVIPEDRGFELPCEICEMLVPSHQLQVHQESCLIAQQEAFQNYGPQTTPHEEELVVVDDDKDDPIHVIPCEFCKESFPADNVILHQPYCAKNPQKLDPFSSGFDPSQDLTSNFQPMMNNTQDYMNQRLREFSSEYQTTMSNFDEPFFSAAHTESFSRIRSQPPLDSERRPNPDTSIDIDEWDIIYEDARLDRNHRSERDRRFHEG